MLEEKSLKEIEDDVITDLVKYCDEDFLANFKLNDAELSRLKNSLNHDFLAPNATIPMICQGAKCILKKVCPLIGMNKFPLGKKCPLELLLANKWKDEYVDSLKADWNDKVDRMLISELIEIDIMSARANTILSDEGFIMDNPVGVNEQTGAPVMRKEIHVAMSLKELLYKRRSKLLKEMIATREAKAKFMKDMVGDPSEYAAKLRAKAAAIQRDRDKTTVIDASELMEDNNENI
jgi:hypothetical protein